MHLGNAALSPECAVITWGTAGVGLTIAARAIRKTGVQPEKIAVAAALGASVFAAQMINVPILSDTSAHLVGGALMAWLIGPSLGIWTMAVVLAVQALLLGDGGLVTWGVNVTTMALLPAGLVACLPKNEGLSPMRSALTAGVTAALSLVLACVLIIALVAASGTNHGLATFGSTMFVSHLLFGLAEGVLTGLLVASVVGAGSRSRRVTFGFAAAAALLVVALPLSSSLPDTYEAAAVAANMSALLADGGSAVAAWQSGWTGQIDHVFGDERLVALCGALLCASLVVALMPRPQGAQ